MQKKSKQENEMNMRTDTLLHIYAGFLPFSKKNRKICVFFSDIVQKK